MIQEVAFSSAQNLELALKDVFGQLKRSPDSCTAVIFFASVCYDFPELAKRIHEHFPKCPVIGTSTSGEISTTGFLKQSLVVTTITDASTRVSGVIIDDTDKFPIVYKSKIEEAARKVGIALGQNGANRDCFALTFINGLGNSEESTLALHNAVIGDRDFVIAGGSAGDDLKFNQTYVSYNGEVVSRGAAVLFIKTQKRFVIKSENIFAPSGKRLRISDVDIESRTIKTINGQSPRKMYARTLGITEAEAENAALQHPMGRAYGDDVFISSIANFNRDGSIGMYCRVLPNSELELMNPLDPIEIAEKTGAAFTKEISRPGCVLLVNCILRTIGFEQQHLTSRVAEVWKKYFPFFCGFSSYGEQMDRLNFNQTLLAIVIEA